MNATQPASRMPHGISQNPDQHLTEEQFGDLLSGESPDSNVQAHLAACIPCRDEVASVLESLDHFNDLSLTWAEREAPRRVPTPSRWALRLGAQPAWRYGLMTAATAVAVAVGLRMPHPGAPSAPYLSAPYSQMVNTAPTGAEIAKDNRLLASIDEELRYAPQPAVPVSELEADASRAESSAAANGEAVAN